MLLLRSGNDANLAGDMSIPLSACKSLIVCAICLGDIYN